MSDCKIYPADTVDIYGNVWQTVGENIRNGLFGENVKVGYVNIDKGNITSKDFIITTFPDNKTFKIDNINCILVFPESIKEGSSDITISNGKTAATIKNNTTPLSNLKVTIKIIYKDIA